jgi:glutamate synthase domain-containing protein 1
VHSTLYRGLKALGQIIKSIFLLRYIDDYTLRQAIEKQLNKLESANKFSRAVFYGNNQEFQQETKEEQVIAEGCKRLIQNAIIFWNYLYLSEKVANTATGEKRKQLLIQIKNSSVVPWQHINLHGEFDFSDEKLKDATTFHLTKIKELKVA